jgi:hypothetical protein
MRNSRQAHMRAARSPLAVLLGYSPEVPCADGELRTYLNSGDYSPEDLLPGPARPGQPVQAPCAWGRRRGGEGAAFGTGSPGCPVRAGGRGPP